MPSKEYAKLFFPFSVHLPTANAPTAAAFLPLHDDKLNENPNPNKRYLKEDGSIMVSLAARTKPKAVEMAYQQTYSVHFASQKSNAAHLPALLGGTC